MPFVVVYDANALYGNAQRDLLIRIAQSGLVQAKWTDQILDEMLGNLGKKRPDIPAEKLGTLRELMNKAVRNCPVTGYEPLIESLQLPDPDDRHVLAAAIKSGAQVIVTTNLRHFPGAELQQWSVEAKSPDDFVLDQINIDARIVYSCVREIANSRRNPPDTVDDVLAELERAGLVQSVAALRLG
ncbi:MAG TPA: PIN domain-containing protein [Streptosporangiaceae bacterium]